MKKIILTLTLVTFVALSTAMAQDVQAPEQGALIYLQDKSLEIAPGQTETIQVQLVRSDRARKARFDPIAVKGNDAVNFELTPVEGQKDIWNLTITATDGASDGSYFYVLSSRGRGTTKVKGTTMTVKVNKEAVARNNE